MSVIEKCFIVGNGAQRDRELLLSRPHQQMFVVHRIRMRCTKVQTTQAFKTDPPISVWSSPQIGWSALPCSQHRKSNRILSRKGLHGDWPGLGPYHCSCPEPITYREKLPGGEVTLPGKDPPGTEWASVVAEGSPFTILAHKHPHPHPRKEERWEKQR